MKSEKRYTGWLVVVALWLAASVGSLAQPARPRIAPKQAAAVTPTPTPTPTAPTFSPTPVPSPTPTPAVAGSTVEELQSKIRHRISTFDVRRGRIGVKIASLRTGKIIFENDADKYFMPASNMKNFTVATALEKLTPDFKFVTSVYANAPADATGIIRGDLRVFGRGDISVSTAFFGTSPSDPQTYYKGIDNLVDKIIAAGVRRIEGSIVGDESYFKGGAIPSTWEWDDLQWYYGAEISALPINDNAVDIAVLPGAVGTPCVVSISPPNTLFQVTNLCTTSGGSTKRSLGVNKRIDRNVLEITGTMPAGDSGFRNSITITRPADLFVALLKQRLEARGISVTGTARTLPTNMRADWSQVEIARLESPPLSLIAAKIMKPSQNMYTENLLWTLGEQLGRGGNPNADSSQLGIAAVKSFMRQIGIPDDGIVQYDGSGLSRHDLITPSAVVALYTYMANQSRFSQAWRNSLTIGGVDGTLASRFKGTAAEGNLRGKTGTIDQVSALSGYVTTAAGDPIVLSIVVNGVPTTRTRTALIDDIVVAVANFTGRLE